jgi:hypothetical protein
MEMFVNHFFGEAKLNAEKAAALAGYKNPRKMATELLGRPAVVEEMERRLAQIASNTKVTPDMIEDLLYREATNHDEDDSSPQARVASLHVLAKVKGMLDKGSGQAPTTVNVNISIGGEDKTITVEGHRIDD